MQQLPLPVINPGPDLTEFRCGPPPMIGWWRVRVITDFAAPGRSAAPAMRFWRGGPTPVNGVNRWSQPVCSEYAGRRLADLAWTLCTIDESQMEYQGLTAPSRDGLYPYPLGENTLRPDNNAAWDWEVVGTNEIVGADAFQINPSTNRVRAAPPSPNVRIRVSAPPGLTLPPNPSARIRVLTK